MKLPSSWELPESIKIRLGDQAGKQRAMAADGHLLLILHRMPKPGDRDREGVLFWRNPAGEWKNNGGVGGITVLKKHLEDYEVQMSKLESDYDRAKSAEDFFSILEAIAPLHRAAKNQHLTLQSAREALPEARELINLRDIAYEVDRDSELLQIDAKSALDYKVAKQVEEQSRLSHQLAQASHQLNVLAALFLPLMAIASVFGMSIPSGLEKWAPMAFWIVFLLGIILGVAVLSGLNSNDYLQKKLNSFDLKKKNDRKVD